MARQPDENGRRDRVLTKAELQGALNGMDGVAMDVDRLIREMDENRDGVISEEECGSNR